MSGCEACDEASRRIGLRLPNMGDELARTVFDEHHALEAAKDAEFQRLFGDYRVAEKEIDARDGTNWSVVTTGSIEDWRRFDKLRVKLKEGSSTMVKCDDRTFEPQVSNPHDRIVAALRDLLDATRLRQMASVDGSLLEVANDSLAVAIDAAQAALKEAEP